MKSTSESVSKAMFDLHRAKWIARAIGAKFRSIQEIEDALWCAWERGIRQGKAMERKRWRRVGNN